MSDRVRRAAGFVLAGAAVAAGAVAGIAENDAALLRFEPGPAPAK